MFLTAWNENERKWTIPGLRISYNFCKLAAALSSLIVAMVLIVTLTVRHLPKFGRHFSPAFAAWHLKDSLYEK